MEANLKSTNLDPSVFYSSTRVKSIKVIRIPGKLLWIKTPDYCICIKFIQTMSKTKYSVTTYISIHCYSHLDEKQWDAISSDMELI